jgi:phthiocerol/phenolphthiocerol synthesis type-I polyketide synthase D
MSAEPRTPDSGDPPSAGQLRRLLIERISRLCEIPTADVDPARPLQEYGLSSRDAVMMAGELSELLGQELQPTLAWDYPTIDLLAQGLAELPASRQAGAAEAQARPVAVTARGGTAGALERQIAVVGIGCRLPGGAVGTLGGPGSFWEFLADGRDAITDVPDGRWDAFDDGTWQAADVLARASKRGGFLGDVAGFDAEFFGISGVEAEAMDPQQRLLLEVAWETLEDAGIPPRSLGGSQTGVFAGISSAEYTYLATADLSGIEAWTATGVAPSIAAGRLAYQLDLHGPAMAVDTACSSSLMAVHLAVRSLRAGECDLALAGGVNLLLSPVVTLAFDRGGATSALGRCAAFGADADGMVRGEGCAFVALKRLSDAQRNGDRVLAVLLGSAANSDGRSNGLVAPSGPAQRAVLRAACSDAGVTAGDVGYVEAHGTGTPLGDAIEAQSLGAVYGGRARASAPLLIGSVKSNLGHTEAAAGVVGLIKVVLALVHRMVPASLHAARPNPDIPLAGLGLAVASAARPWPGNVSGPALAGVSAFGFSGTNVHVLLGPAPEESPSGIEPAEQETGEQGAAAGGANPPLAFHLSDRDSERLAAQAEQLGHWVSQQEPLDLPGLARSLRGRSSGPGRGNSRAVVAAADAAELAGGLRALARGDAHPGLATAAVPPPEDGSAPPGGPVLVFSGYGSQWPGMAQRLASAEPVFADALGELDPLLKAESGLSLTTEITSGSACLRATDVAVSQPLIFGVQVALARLLGSYGIRPAAVIGHSMGEVAAAVVAGAITAADGAAVICARSRMLRRLAGHGAMAIVAVGAADAAELAAGLDDVHVAVYSAPRQTVLTGNPAQLDELARRAGSAGIGVRVLAAEGAGHSPQVDPLLEPLRAALDGLTPSVPQVRWYSTVLDDPWETPKAGPGYWAANLRQPVRLVDAVQAAAADGHRIFTEVSPQPILVRPLSETLAGQPGTFATGTLRGHTDDVLTFHGQLGLLEAAGLPVRRRGGLAEPGGGSTAERRGGGFAPPAPWRHRRYWVAQSPRRQTPGHPLLGTHAELPGSDMHVWTAELGDPPIPGMACPIFPLAAAAEMAFAAAAQVWRATPGQVRLTGLRLRRMRTVAVGSQLTTVLRISEPSGGRLTVHLRNAAGRAEPVATVRIRVHLATAAGLAGPGGRGCVVPVEQLDRALRGSGETGTPVAAAVLSVDGEHGDGDLRFAVFGRELSAPAEAGIPVPYRQKVLRVTWVPAELPDSGRRANGQERTARVAIVPGTLRASPGGSAAGLANDLAAELSAAGHVVSLAATHDGAADADVGSVVLVAPEGLPIDEAERMAGDACRLAAGLAGIPDPPRLWLLAPGATATRPNEASDPGLSALRGLVRVLAFEAPALRATLLDPGPLTPQALACAAAEIGADGPDDDVAWRDGGRLVARLTADAEGVADRAEYAERNGAGSAPAMPAVRAGDAYVITGGCGGLGLQVARWLADAGAGRIVLSGRSGASEHAQAVIGKLRRRRTEIVVVRGDIAKPGTAERLVAAATANGSKLRGVVHAAGVAADALVADVQPEDLAAIWAPKVRGAQRLHAATAQILLDWFVLFSSAAALLGSPGQAGYATANAYLDAFAHWRRAAGYPATALGWGVWGQTGGAAGLNVRGIDPLTVDEGIEALEAAVVANETSVGIVRIDPGVVGAAFPEIASMAYFSGLLSAAGQGASSWPGPAALRSAGRQMRAMLMGQLAERAAGICGVPVADLSEHSRLADAGLDSLAATRLANVLEHDVGVSVDGASLLNGTTLGELADWIIASIGGSADAPAGRPAHLAGKAEPGESKSLVTPAAGGPVIREPEELAAGKVLRLLQPPRPGQTSAGAPLFLAHPAGGTTGVYQQLAGLLGDGGAVYGLERLPAGGPAELADRAASYAGEIAAACPDRVCLLGGWSFGGVLAYETARQLAADGWQIPLVVLLDAGLPLPVPGGNEQRALARRFAAFSEYLNRTYGVNLVLTEDELAPLAEDAQLQLLIRRVTESGLAARLSPTILRHQRTSHEDTRALERYRPLPYAGHTVLYRATQETPWAVRDARYDHTDETRGWAGLCATLDVVPVAAHHLNLLDPPAVTSVATHLQVQLSRFGGWP